MILYSCEVVVIYQTLTLTALVTYGGCFFSPASKFLSALAEDGAINEESLSQDQLNSVYMPLREQVSSSLSRQEALLGKIQVRHPL